MSMFIYALKKSGLAALREYFLLNCLYNYKSIAHFCSANKKKRETFIETKYYLRCDEAMVVGKLFRNCLFICLIWFKKNVILYSLLIMLNIRVMTHNTQIYIDEIKYIPLSIYKKEIKFELQKTLILVQYFYMNDFSKKNFKCLKILQKSDKNNLYK